MKLPSPNINEPWHVWSVRLIRVLIPIIPQITTGVVTLGTGTATTVPVTGITIRQRVYLTPVSADAAQAQAYVSDVLDGRFVVTHFAGSASRTFNYLVI